MHGCTFHVARTKSKTECRKTRMAGLKPAIDSCNVQLETCNWLYFFGAGFLVESLLIESSFFIESPAFIAVFCFAITRSENFL